MERVRPRRQRLASRRPQGNPPVSPVAPMLPVSLAVHWSRTVEVIADALSHKVVPTYSVLPAVTTSQLAGLTRSAAASTDSLGSSPRSISDSRTESRRIQTPGTPPQTVNSVSSTDPKGKGTSRAPPSATTTGASTFASNLFRRNTPSDIHDAVRNAGLTPLPVPIAAHFALGSVFSPPPAPPRNTNTLQVQGSASSIRSTTPSRTSAANTSLLTVPGAPYVNSNGEVLSRTISTGTSQSAVSSSRSSFAETASSASSVDASAAIGAPELIRKKKKKKKPQSLQTTIANPTVVSPSQNTARPDNAHVVPSNRLTAPEAGHGAASSFPVNRPVVRSPEVTPATSQSTFTSSSTTVRSPPAVSHSRRSSRQANVLPATPAESSIPPSRPAHASATNTTAAADHAPLTSSTTLSGGPSRIEGALLSTDGRQSPPPPPWTPPETTITLAFTPMHAYVAEYHDEPAEMSASEQESTRGQTRDRSADPDTPLPSTTSRPVNPLPPIPNSPPPAFRSRPPTPQGQQSVSAAEQAVNALAGPSQPRSAVLTSHRERAGNESDEYLSDVDVSAIELLDRGYASSETEADLLRKQGRALGPYRHENLSGDDEHERLWRLRHWEAWRREGMSLTDRWLRLQGKASNLEGGSEAATVSVLAAQAAVLRQVQSAASSEPTGLYDERGPDPDKRSVSPPTARRDLPNHPSPQLSPGLPAGGYISPAGSDMQAPRFPSVGSVRRARLKRFEAQRRDSRMLSSVMEARALPARPSAPSTESDDTQRKTSPDALMTTSDRPFSNSTSTADPTRIVLTAAASPIQGPTNATDIPDFARNAANATRTSPLSPERSASITAVTGPAVFSRPPPSLPPSAPLPTPATPSPPRLKLAQQLAAEIEAKRRSSPTATSTRSPNSSALQTEALPNLASPPSHVLQQAAVTDLARQREVSVIQEDSPLAKADKQPSRSKTTRLAELLRQHVPQANVSMSQSDAPASSRREVVPAISDGKDPASTLSLPRAPPRVTTDLLSTDNLRKLKHQSVRAPLEGSSSDDDDGDDGSNESGSSSSDSDSADGDGDGDSTVRKPTSSLQSYPSTAGLTGPGTPRSDTFATNQSDRETAAATWRRNEEGRRYSALLSRPLSVKRKPPPVPPKRWGRIWDGQSVQEQLSSGNNFDNEVTQGMNASMESNNSLNARALPARLAGNTLLDVVEEPAWEVFGQDERQSANGLVHDSAWETIGRADQEVVSTHPIPTTSTLQPPLQMNSHLIINETSHLAEDVVQGWQSSVPLQRSAATLRRSSAVRRPSSLAAMAGNRSSERVQQGTSAPSSPMARVSQSTRESLSARPRHVYSASVPNATVNSNDPTSSPPRPRRPLPQPPVDQEVSLADMSEDRQLAMAISASLRPSAPPREPSLTDLDVALASLESAPAKVRLMRVLPTDKADTHTL